MTVKKEKESSLSIIEEMRSLEDNGEFDAQKKFSPNSGTKSSDKDTLSFDCDDLFNDFYEGILLTDCNSEKIIYANKRASEILNLRNNDLIGKKTNVLFDHKSCDKKTSESMVNDSKDQFKRRTKKITLNNTSYILDFFIRNKKERAHDKQLERKEQLIKYQRILLDLSKKGFDTFQSALEYTLENVSQILEIDRCSFWLFNESHDRIICKDLFVKERDLHFKDDALFSNDHPAYFKAIENELIIDASDAMTDYRTREFKQNYLKPLNVVSMLDVPVRLHGKNIGVICCETVGIKRYWTDEEKNLVKSISDFIGLQYEKNKRVELKEKLDKSERQAKKILEAVADGIRIIDNNFNIINANKTMERLSGYSKEQIIGNNCKNVFPSEFCGTEECSLKKVLSTGKGFIRESKRKMDGKEIHCIEVVTPYKDDNGNLVGIIEDFRDISYLKQTQQQLVLEKKKAQEYLDVANVIMILLDDQANIKLINKKGCKTLGYSENELLGKNWFKLCYDSNSNEKQGLYNQYILGKISFPQNDFSEVIAKNGEKRIINWNAALIYDDLEQKVSMLSSGQDVTQEIITKRAKKKADKILEKRSIAFRILYDTALEVENKSKNETIKVFCKNLRRIGDAEEGIIGIFNSTEESFVFYRFDEERNNFNLCNFDLSSEDITTDIFTRFKSGLLSSELDDTSEIDESIINNLLKKFGLNGDFSVFNFVKSLDESSYVIGIILKEKNQKLDMKDMIDTYINLISIIFQRVKSHEDLIASEKRYRLLSNELEEKVKERTIHIQRLLNQKDAFINQLGHDLKHPINPLINLLPILEKKNTDPKCQEIFDVLKRNTGYMKSLVTKTIRFAQLNAPNTEFTFESTNIYDLIDDILMERKFLFDKKNIKIVNEVDKDLVADVDRLAFSELIENLLNNAVKYNKINGRIDINNGLNEDTFSISIQDTGIGMNDEQITHVFEEFYKADPARHDFDSSGLGMSICNRIIKKHNGKIWLESEGLDKGTTVHFLIPIHQH